jgi:crotonobetainyl-CoA:carnitine CoA-transferase CaiB-like acyl-CoA transferase
MLAGYRVVELSIWVAGPAIGGIMSDWGADVIKVEGPAGDPMRGIYRAVGVQQDRVPPYELDNRGKRCVMLDLTTESGRSHMDSLLATADVFVTNLRIPALEKLGLEHESVMKRFPRLVYAAVTGYGLQGPDRDRAGYDAGAFWARSSLAHTHAVDGEMPPVLRSGVGDHVTGMTGVAGVLAALLNREKTGEGRVVDISLLRTGIYMNGWDIATRQYFGRIQRTRARTANPAPMIGCYPTGDGEGGDGRGVWLIGLEQDRHWPIVKQALGYPAELDDERFANSVLRAKHAQEVVAELDRIFRTYTYDDLTAAFDAAGVWWAPINSIADVIDDPQAIAAGAFVDMPVEEGENPYQLVNTPVSFVGWSQPTRSVRALGADTDSVLAELAD